MRHYSGIFYLLGSLLLLGACSNQMTINTLKEKISSKLAEQPGDFAVAFKDLSTGEILQLNDQEFFNAARTKKTPVMIEV